MTPHTGSHRYYGQNSGTNRFITHPLRYICTCIFIRRIIIAYADEFFDLIWRSGRRTRGPPIRWRRLSTFSNTSIDNRTIYCSKRDEITIEFVLFSRKSTHYEFLNTTSLIFVSLYNFVPIFYVHWSSVNCRFVSPRTGHVAVSVWKALSSLYQNTTQPLDSSTFDETLVMGSMSTVSCSSLLHTSFAIGFVHLRRNYNQLTH